jgi:hypothetical protein
VRLNIAGMGRTVTSALDSLNPFLVSTCEGTAIALSKEFLANDVVWKSHRADCVGDKAPLVKYPASTAPHDAGPTGKR